MGLDYSAITVIGVELLSEDLYTNGKVRNCYHDLVTETAKFCPECGKVAYIDSKVMKIPEFEDGGGSIVQDDLELVYFSESIYYFGLKQRSTLYNNNNMLYLDDLDIIDLKRRIKEFLEPYDLWDESSFGLYTILEIS